MAAAPVSSCQFVALKSPWGHLGSLVDVRNRLHRIRCRFQHISANSLINAAHKTMNSLASSRRAPRSAQAVQATTHNQTYPERPPGADLPPKKVCNLDPMAPMSALGASLV